ncbi:hypothetical protein L1987_48201 [Smallanthus sonchifolius]|uniref:Uncharacterized protein n=1 Tax=Smallanthus sonchifolius TaxID=185202 RepID=A0ACB9FS80_9ASTR|nr:hypothetical protein L1987_48201 [Smallanthus sonchifolius]
MSSPLAAANAEGDWIQLLDDGGGGGEFKENGWRNSNERNKGIGDAMVIDDGEPHKNIRLGKLKGISSIKLVDHDDHSLTENRRWGLVYSRKRIRRESYSCSDLDKKFEKKFSWKQSRKNIVSDGLPPYVLLPNMTTTKTRLSGQMSAAFFLINITGSLANEL